MVQEIFSGRQRLADSIPLLHILFHKKLGVANGLPASLSDEIRRKPSLFHGLFTALFAFLLLRTASGNGWPGASFHAGMNPH